MGAPEASLIPFAAGSNLTLTVNSTNIAASYNGVTNTPSVLALYFCLRCLNGSPIFRGLFWEISMSIVCDVCGKGPRVGNRIVRHGLAKKKGGVGLHTTGVTPRRFIPNLQRIRTIVGGSRRTLRVCTSCIKAGKVVKA